MSNSDTGEGSEESGIKITLGKLIAYPVGGLLILAGLGSLVESVVGGILILLAGVIALPIVRSRLKRSQGIAINRWATLGLVLVLVIAGGVMLAGNGEGDLNGQNPEESGDVTRDSADHFIEVEEGNTIRVEVTVEEAGPEQTLVRIDNPDNDQVLEEEIEEEATITHQAEQSGDYRVLIFTGSTASYEIYIDSE